MKVLLLLGALLLSEVVPPTLSEISDSSSRTEILLAINDAKSKMHMGDELRKAVSM